MRSPFAGVFLLVLHLAAPVKADEGSPDTNGPSLEVRTDLVAPWARYALAVDGLGAVWDEYTLSVRVAPTRYTSFRIDTGVRRSRDLIGRVAFELWPMGRGIDGVYLAIGGILESSPRIGVFGETGYAFSWGKLFVDMAARLEWSEGEQRWQARARLALGTVF